MCPFTDVPRHCHVVFDVGVVFLNLSNPWRKLLARNFKNRPYAEMYVEYKAPVKRWCKLQVSLAFDRQLASTCINSHQLWAVSNFDTIGREFEKARRQLTFVCNSKIQTFVYKLNSFPQVKFIFTRLYPVNSHRLACNSRSRLTEQSCKSLQVHANSCLPTRIFVWPGLKL